jgi:NAD+ kinase
VKSIGVIVHPAKEAALEAETRLVEHGRRRGIEVSEATEDGAYDLIVALGGDGTMLKAAALAARAQIPLLGINIGRFGYLASVAPDQMEEAVEAVSRGECMIDRRMMVTAETEGGGVEPVQAVALNEMVLDRESASRVIRVEVLVESQSLATYTVDGFIVATPTGSTAYSLSAGGPIVEPGLDAMVLTPVSPHWPLWRSVVVAPDRSVRLVVVEGKATFAADGRSVTTLQTGGGLVVRRFEEPVQLVHLGGYSFFERIRSRFSMEPKQRES